MTPSAAEITRRLREASRLSRLDASSRLDGKLDMSSRAVTARLREVAALLALCQRLSVTK